MNFRPKRLNQSGFDHVMLVVIFVVLFALVGTFLLIASHAATTYVELHIGSNGGKCVNGTTLVNCSSSSKEQVWATMSGSNFRIQNQAGQCLDDWNGAVGTNASNRVYMRVNTCYSNDTHQEWNWSNHRLVNAASKGCINSLNGNEGAGADLIIFTCNSQNNEEYFETSVSSGGSSSSGSADGTAFIARAIRWQGLGYANTGGYGGDGGLMHADSYATFVKDCEGGSDGGTPKITGGTDSECATDCSGFVSLVVDDVLHKSYVWIAGDEVLTGSGASNWKAVSASSAQPGDIAVSDGHVEFVRSGTGTGLTSFGEHQSGTTVGDAHMPTPFIVYRWE